MSRHMIDDALCEGRSRYSLVIAVAKRAREISNDAEMNGEILLEKPVNLAIEDLAAHKFQMVEPDCED